MKKLILMTSALTMIGGAAAAEITISGEAEVTYGNWDAAATAGFGVSTTASIDMTGASGGYEYGASISIDADDSHVPTTTVVDADGITKGVVYISGGFGKLSYGIDEFDAVTDGSSSDSGDLQYEYSMGSIGITFTTETADGVEVGGGSENDWDLAVSYAGDGFTLGASTDSADYSDISIEVDLGGYSVGGSADSASAWDIFVSAELGGMDATVTYDSADVAGLELSGAADAVTWGLTYNTNDEMTASLGYAAGALSVGVEYDSTNAGGTGDDAETIVTVSYALTDEATASAMMNDQSEYELGLALGFSF